MGKVHEVCDRTGMSVVRREGRAFHLDDTPCFGRDGRIVQLVGASPNWSSVNWLNGVESRRPIACWALVEDCSGTTRVAGVVPDSAGQDARIEFGQTFIEPSLVHAG